MAQPSDGPTIATTEAPGKGRVSPRSVSNTYRTMLLWLFALTVVTIAVTGCMAARAYRSGTAPSLISFVVLSGVLGALFSALTRLYRIQDHSEAMLAEEVTALPTLHLLIYSLVPMVLGAIAALAIHMLFASEMITSDLFPRFGCKPQGANCDSLEGLIGKAQQGASWGPMTAVDYAKDIVWAFIAGFAERFAPSILQTLSASVQPQSGSPKKRNSN